MNKYKKTLASLESLDEKSFHNGIQSFAAYHTWFRQNEDVLRDALTRQSKIYEVKNLLKCLAEESK